jgi:hypothetical protein
LRASAEGAMDGLPSNASSSTNSAADRARDREGRWHRGRRRRHPDYYPKKKAVLLARRATPLAFVRE